MATLSANSSTLSGERTGAPRASDTCGIHTLDPPPSSLNIQPPDTGANNGAQINARAPKWPRRHATTVTRQSRQYLSGFVFDPFAVGTTEAGMLRNERDATRKKRSHLASVPSGGLLPMISSRFNQDAFFRKRKLNGS